jgi:hypothetical protein
MIYQTILTEHNTIVMRVKANSREEAEEIMNRVLDEEADYISEEFDMSGTKEWSRTSMEEVHPSKFDERATVTENEDGSLEIQYEGGDE